MDNGRSEADQHERLLGERVPIDGMQVDYLDTRRELDVWNSVARNHSADHVAHPQEAPLWRWVAQSGSLHLPQQAAGRHCASRLCWTSTSTTHGRKSRSSKTSRGVELSQIVMWVAQQVLDILYMKILKQVMACKPLQWFSFPGSSSLVEKQGRMCAMKYYYIMIIWLDCMAVWRMTWRM